MPSRLRCPREPAQPSASLKSTPRIIRRMKSHRSRVPVLLASRFLPWGSSRPRPQPHRRLRSGRFAPSAGSPKRKLEELLRLLSPKFQRTCAFKAFLPTGRQEEQQLHGATLRVLADRATGSDAYLTYEFLRGGLVLGKATGDLYVKVGSKWFDELDKYTTC